MLTDFSTPLEDSQAIANDKTLIEVSRLPAWDKLRVLAMLLGIVLHAFLAYAPSIEPHWPIHDPMQHPLFDFGVFLIHLFRMELFFFIAGFFAYSLYLQKGIRLFFGNRLKKIVGPFLGFWLLTNLSFMFMPVKNRPGLELTGIPLYHLWFLYYLFFFYGLTACFMFVDRLSLRVSTYFDQFFSTFIQSPFHLILLTLITAPCLVFMDHISVDTPYDSHLLGRLFAYYSIFFMMGWMIAKQENLLGVLTKHYRIYSCLAMMLSPLLFYLFEIGNLDSHPSKAVLGSVAFLYALSTWVWVLGLLGIAHRYGNKTSVLISYLAKASYWIYLAHFPLIIVLQHWLLDSPMDLALKPCLVFFITVGSLLLSYKLFART